PMSGSPGPRNPHRLRAVVVLLYACILAGSTFLHHDLACGQDSRTHCIACSVSQNAQKVESQGVSLDALHRVAGRVELRTHASIDAPAVTFLSDRAPPA